MVQLLRSHPLGAATYSTLTASHAGNRTCLPCQYAQPPTFGLLSLSLSLRSKLRLLFTGHRIGAASQIRRHRRSVNASTASRTAVAVQC